jgi:hypothetical protein
MCFFGVPLRPTLRTVYQLTMSTPQARALELPKEHEMPAKDKYTVFSPHARGYRKGIHKVPKWTRV